jgi:hypothetical protein
MEATVITVTATEAKKTSKGVEFNILTLANGVKIKAYRSDWSTMPTALDSNIHRLYQPASFIGADGKTIHQLPVLRHKSNASTMQALGFTVNRPKQSKPE